MDPSFEIEAARAALCEMTRRAREAEAVAAAYRHHLVRIEALLDAEDNPSPVVQRAHCIALAIPGEHDAGRAFLGRVEQLERAQGATPDTEGERYPMCKDQPAQLDCRMTTCRYHRAGQCVNISPAITLQPEGYFYCWSMEARDGAR
jgi:hypothetical protein